MHDDDVDRLRALLKSGRDKLRSFFTVLQEVRKKIGDDARFERWCIEELKVGLGVITNIAKVLKADDKALTRGLAATPQRRGQEAKQLAAARTRIRELETELTLARAARQPIHGARHDEPLHKPRRDRRDYMREFMRKKRAKKFAGPAAGARLRSSDRPTPG